MSTEKILKGMVALNFELEKSDLTPTEKWEQSLKNTHFISQQPKLGMFIACDKDGNVLEEPIETIGGVEEYSKKYQQALSEVIFDGFIHTSTIDNLVYLYNEKITLIFDTATNEIEYDTLNSNGIAKTIEDLVPFNLKMK